MEEETLEISTGSNGHTINPSQSDSSPRPSQAQKSEEKSELEEREEKLKELEEQEEREEELEEEEEKRELEEQERMASDTNEEKLDSARISVKKKFISQSRSMERSSIGTSRGGVPRTSLSPVITANGERERILEKSSSRKSLSGGIRKPLHPENTLHEDDDDTCSVTSSTTPSVRAARNKITIPMAPTFRCGERAEKRREYYTKLEEKHKAMEEEKKQADARKKEEQEATIKELRKTLVVRANPVPSFYHEPPPPKIALKKVPPTRARSPKLTRRKSCSDAKEREGIMCGRNHRHSLETCNKESPTKLPPSTPKTPIIAKVKPSPKSASTSTNNIPVHT